MTVFALPPGARFAEAFAAGFWERYGALPPEEIARVEVLLNNQRSVRVVTDAFSAAAPGAVLLPRISVLAELGNDPLRAPDLPPAIDPIRRHLRLIRLVEAFLSREGGSRIAPLSAAPDLARGLAQLLDDCDEAGLAIDALDHATDGEHAEHWDRNLRFLDVIRTFWPRILLEDEAGAPGPKARQRAVVERLAAQWAQTPPEHPVIAAASTGSVATTAELMAAVARIPGGIVLLPGFDRTLPRDIWETVVQGGSPEHPMAPFAALLGALQLQPCDVLGWGADSVPAARHQLLTQALRPAPVTDSWHREAEGLSIGLAEATQALSLIEAPGPRQEAAAVALAVRRALDEPKKTALILTQDAALGRRITAELGRYGIEPDDSLGTPLAQTPPGVFLRLIAAIAEGQAGPVEIAALIKHPLFQVETSAPDTQPAEAYERDVLRRRGAGGGDTVPDWPDCNADQAAWLETVRAALRPLADALGSGRDLGTVSQAHLSAAAQLSTASGDSPAVWEREAGAVARHLLERLNQSADAFGTGGVSGYGALITAMMRSEEVRMPGQTPHPRVTLMSPRESRVASADLVILAGLNEGGWPRLPTPDPWLSRPMRAALGLPPPERVIGLSAHDFQQAAMAPEVILTRATKQDGTPTIASRWLTRLEILADGLDRHQGHAPRTIAAMRARGQALLALTSFIHHPDEAMRKTLPPAQRPMPRPPVAARPKTVSVTTIETLIRDAYAVYARHILKLLPIDPLGNAPDLRDRGLLIHTIMERFTVEMPGTLPATAREILISIAEEVLKEQVPSPALRRIWLARIGRFADWFLEGEAQRRSGGVTPHVEVKGVMDLTGLATHRITARADRIDLRPGGGAAIYDYKAGTPPTSSQIDAGFNHQLHLQAAILAAGGFEGIQGVMADTGAYIGLSGSGAGGKVTERNNLYAEVAEHLDRVRRLLAAYDREETPYRARGLVQQSTVQGDYDHLARWGEWERSDD